MAAFLIGDSKMNEYKIYYIYRDGSYFHWQSNLQFWKATSAESAANEFKQEWARWRGHCKDLKITEVEKVGYAD